MKNGLNFGPPCALTQSLSTLRRTKTAVAVYRA